MSITNQKPSGVMLDSYNSRISKLMKYKPSDVVSYELVDSTATGKTIANVTMSNGNVEPVVIMRYNLNEVLVPNAAGYVIIDVTSGESAMESYPGGFVGLLKVVAEACGIDSDDTVMLQSFAFEFTTTLWLMHGVFIPPSEVTFVDITQEASTVAYTDTLTQIVSGVTIVQAKADSLGYTGSVKMVLVVAADTVPETPKL